MKIITVYAVVKDEELITTYKTKESAIEYCITFNEAHKTDKYEVLECNGLIII